MFRPASADTNTSTDATRSVCTATTTEACRDFSSAIEVTAPSAPGNITSSAVHLSVPVALANSRLSTQPASIVSMPNPV